MIEARFHARQDTFTLDLDLSIPAHGITALFGVSGSGKTTLLRHLAGLARNPGRLSINGEIWQDERFFLPTYRRALGYVFQEANLFPHLSVRANLRYGMQRVPLSERTLNWDDVIGWLGLAPLISLTPHQLSGGQRQRVAIGRALLASPRLLLMDEPLAALDAQARAEILPCLDQLHRELAIPVVYVSHTVDEIARLADYLVRLDAGRVVWQGAMATGGLAQLGAAPRYAATVLANDAGRILLEISHPQLASLAQPGTVFQVRLD